MPYIKKEDRKEVNIHPDSAGELNYYITKICLKYLDMKTIILADGERIQFRDASYEDYNTVIGALEAAKLEFYRRAVSKYEDKKIEKNGDVY